MIIGCDYSTKFIDLAFDDGGWMHFRIKVDQELEVLLEELKSIFEKQWEGSSSLHLYIERPWARYNVATGMSLQRISTIVDVVATQCGYYTHWVAIQSWRSKVFGKGKYTTDVAKQLSLQKAKELGISTKDHNISDAVCLAVYGMGDQG